jgi:hypothetical protein
MYAPKCLVIVSHWGFCDCFNKFLIQLYNGASSANPSPRAVHARLAAGVKSKGLSYPLERIVSNFICEVPLVTAARPPMR